MKFCNKRTAKAGKDGVRSYLDHASAVAALREQQEIPDAWHRKGRRPTRVYQCPECGFYHLTAKRLPPHAGS